MLEIKKTKYALGAFVHGLDLTKKISDLEFELLLKALAENEVLFFRDNTLVIWTIKELPLCLEIFKHILHIRQ